MYTLNILLDESLDDDIISYYRNLEDKETTDSGVDLVAVTDTIAPSFDVTTLNFKIKCEMVKDDKESFPYYLYPRSSISKTPLIMANSVGIIDKDYRGNIMAKVRNIPNKPNVSDEYLIKKGTRLFQICSHNLSPVKVRVITKLSQTSRGEGGFGSTGVGL